MKSLARPKILAIDDTPENLVVLATALMADFDFQLAASGREGLALAAKSPPDLILLDVMMPELDGFEVCRRLKATPALAEIPVVFVTALSDFDSELTGLAAGAADFVTKPIQVELVRQRIRNILKLTRLAADLRASEERLRLVMDASGDGLWDWSVATGEVAHNSAWYRMLGLQGTELSDSLVDHKARIHPDDLPTYENAMRACADGESVLRLDYRIRHQQGHYLWVTDRAKVVARDAAGGMLRMVGSIKDIDERKRQEAEIHRLAFFDTLTGLPNRRLLTDRLQQALLKTARNTDFGALMFIDMDHFKELNDRHGHAVGDLLLQQVGVRLSGCIRQQDTVARLGGDEFVIMLEHVALSREETILRAKIVGEKVLAALNQIYTLGSIAYHSTPSIGLTPFSGAAGDTVDGILKRADIAMYQAKADGRNALSVLAGDEGHGSV